jgi:hypothetical protein
MRKQKYKINYFGILNAQYHFVKIASLKKLLINFKNSKYLIFTNLLSSIAFIKILILKVQQYYIVDRYIVDR